MDDGENKKSNHLAWHKCVYNYTIIAHALYA